MIDNCKTVANVSGGWTSQRRKQQIIEFVRDFILCTKGIWNMFSLPKGTDAGELN
jgi:hypothetical protein